MGNNTVAPRLYGGDAQSSRVQENISSVLTPVAQALQNTPIMGAPPPSWIRPSILNSWVQFVSGAVPAFHKDALGYVHVKGALDNASGGASTGPLFNLPAGYRPAEPYAFACVGTAGVIRAVTVAVLGNVTLVTAVPNGDEVFLAFSFLAEG